VAPTTAPIDGMRAALVAARNADGGWPYYKGKASRLEPTVFALLALGEDATAMLGRWPRLQGLFVDSGGALNFGFNGQAAIALARSPDSAVARSLIPGLVRARGLAMPPSVINRQDNSIQAWSWTDGTFSWVESTAWCLLGLKRLAAHSGDSDVRARFDDGRQFFIDRVCKEGGWNDGNSNMLGAELPPYIPTTALALLAMHDQAADPVVQKGLTYLRDRRLTEQGGLALALTRICLGAYGETGADLDAAILSAWTHTGFVGSVHVTALALYALTASGHGFEDFRV
jgi:hypothetical protein